MEELTWKARGRLWLRLGLRLVLCVAAVVLLMKVGLPLLSLLMPFVLASALAWAFNRPIRWLQKKLKVQSRGLLSVLFLLLTGAVVGGVLAGLTVTLINQLSSFLQNWQPMWQNTMGAVNSIAARVEEFFRPLPPDVYDRVAGVVDALVDWLGGIVPRLLGSVASKAGSFAMRIPSWAVSTIIFLMATYFISADYPRLRYLAADKIPTELRGFCSQVKRIAMDAFGGYIRAELIVSVFVTAILLMGFMVMGEPYALLVAVLLGFMDFIPLIGSGTVIVPWAVIDVALGNYGHALALAVTWGVIVVFRRVAEPKVVGDQTGLSPIVSLLSIYVGMRLGGVLGMILGPILCLIMVNIARGGTFDNAWSDVRTAARDITAILRPRRESLPPQSAAAIENSEKVQKE